MPGCGFEVISVEDIQMASLSSGERRDSTLMTSSALQFVFKGKGDVQRLQRPLALQSSAFDELLRCAENAK